MGRKSGSKRRKSWSKRRRPSIGSQVGRSLGGHLSKAGKLKSAGGNPNITKRGIPSLKGLGNMLGGFFGAPSYANAMGKLTGNLSKRNWSPAQIKAYAKQNIDVTKMNPSINIGIDTNDAIQGIKNEKIRNWFSKWTPTRIKNLKINHQMYSPTKLKPGDPNYTPTGTGSPQMDKQTEKYLEWMAKANPTGATTSDYKKIYANNLADGRHTLEQVMRMNPANTMSYHALIDDSQDIKKKKLEDIYQAELGRGSDEAGAKYWLDTHAQGDNVDWDNITRMIGSSAEGKKFDARNKLKINSI
tara:strand:- start:190 stop:1089 length:900 start_codon:yes stop_codon:yes gene_type:complete